MVLNWAIKNDPSPCSACVNGKSGCNSTNSGDGYLCKCPVGYDGNPYLLGGCKGNPLYINYSFIKLTSSKLLLTFRIYAICVQIY